MRIWRELLGHSGHAAIDATYFDRRQASNHYLERCDREVQTVQATFLVDTAQGAVIDVHCSTKRPNGTSVGPQIALRNVGDLRTLAADKGYDDMIFCQEIRAEGVRPLIKRPYDSAVRARAWYRQFREITLAAAVYNVEQAVKQ